MSLSLADLFITVRYDTSRLYADQKAVQAAVQQTGQKAANAFTESISRVTTVPMFKSAFNPVAAATAGANAGAAAGKAFSSAASRQMRGMFSATSKASMMIGQAGYAVEDFFTVFEQGGWRAGMRAANNNLSQMAAIAHPLAGVFVGLATSIGTHLVSALMKSNEAMKEQVKTFDDLAEARKRYERGQSAVGQEAATKDRIKAILEDAPWRQSPEMQKLFNLPERSPDNVDKDARSYKLRELQQEKDQESNALLEKQRLNRERQQEVEKERQKVNTARERDSVRDIATKSIKRRFGYSPDPYASNVEGEIDHLLGLMRKDPNKRVGGIDINAIANDPTLTGKQKFLQTASAINSGAAGEGRTLTDSLAARPFTEEEQTRLKALAEESADLQSELAALGDAASRVASDFRLAKTAADEAERQEKSIDNAKKFATSMMQRGGVVAHIASSFGKPEFDTPAGGALMQVANLLRGAGGPAGMIGTAAGLGALATGARGLQLKTMFSGPADDPKRTFGHVDELTNLKARIQAQLGGDSKSERSLQSIEKSAGQLPGLLKKVVDEIANNVATFG